jgi:hypothetical protein
VGWIFLLTVAVYSLTAHLLHKSGKASELALKVGAVVLGFSWWTFLSLLPR